MSTDEMYRAIREWPEHMRSDWQERAAIYEYDAGMDRDEAELRAYNAIRRRPVFLLTRDRKSQ